MLDSGTRFFVPQYTSRPLVEFLRIIESFCFLSPPLLTQPESSLGVGAGKHCCLWWRSWKSNFLSWSSNQNFIFTSWYIFSISIPNITISRRLLLRANPRAVSQLSTILRPHHPPLVHHFFIESLDKVGWVKKFIFRVILTKFFYHSISRLVGCLHHTIIGVLRREWVTFSSKISSLGNIQVRLGNELAVLVGCVDINSHQRLDCLRFSNNTS